MSIDISEELLVIILLINPVVFNTSSMRLSLLSVVAGAIAVRVYEILMKT